MQWLVNFLSDEEGVASVEYVVMLAMIILVILTAVSQLGNLMMSSWITITTALSEGW